MKARTLSVLAGVSAPLIAAGTAQADFLGITFETDLQEGVVAPAPVGTVDIFIVSLIANFDANGATNIFQAVAGTPTSPLEISVTNGTFFNHPFGTNVSPLPSLVPAFPSLVFDSYVDIGQEVQNSEPATTTPPGEFPAGLGASDFGVTSFGGDNDTNGNGIPDGTEVAWARTPADSLSDPFDAGTYPGGGDIFIGRFAAIVPSGADGVTTINFAFNAQVSTDAGVELVPVQMSVPVPAPGTLALVGMAGLVGVRRRRR